MCMCVYQRGALAHTAYRDLGKDAKKCGNENTLGKQTKKVTCLVNE